MPCFCAGITKNCRATGRYRNRITLRFTDEDDFKGTETDDDGTQSSVCRPIKWPQSKSCCLSSYAGVNVTYPSRPGVPPLSSTQILINTEMEEFQLVDLSRRFLNLDSFWSLPRQFLGNKVKGACVEGGGAELNGNFLAGHDRNKARVFTLVE